MDRSTRLKPATPENEAGTYVFDSLTFGDYAVRTILPDGEVQTAPTGDGTNRVSVTAASVTPDVNFGMAVDAFGSIAGVTFNDLDGSGTQDAGEPGLADWTIYADANSNGSLDAGEISVVTGADGSWSFSNIPAGNYVIREVVQSGWIQSFPAADGSHSVTVNAGDAITDTNFGNRELINFATGRSAEQISTLIGAVADLAVDGNTDGDFGNGSVTVTNRAQEAWWQVDLGAARSINYIEVFNRTDTASERLEDFSVFVSNDPFTFDDIASTRSTFGVDEYPVAGIGGSPSRVDVDRFGRYVRVQLTDIDYLSLAEVNVFGLPSTNQPPVPGVDTVTAERDFSKTLPFSSLLANDSDPNGDVLSITAFTQPTNGTILDNQDGTFTYTPDQSFSGSDSFTYTVSDGMGGTATGQVNLAVSANLARFGKATQSSVIAGASAELAIDGSTDGDFKNGSVTATNLNTNAWWELDLGVASNISQIALWNRTDAATDRLSDVSVFVSDVPFVSQLLDETINQPGVRRIQIAGEAGEQSLLDINRTGRFIRVQLEGSNYLSLAEVQVFGFTNLAEGKPAEQSGTIIGADASRAVDGNTSGIFFENSVTATNNNTNAWWQVDLGGVLDIDTIAVWNRTDGAMDRLTDFNILVSDDPFASTDLATTLAQPGVSQFHMAGEAAAPSEFSIGRTGRYVRVQLNGTNYLSLAEVQVFGLPGPNEDPVAAADDLYTEVDGGAITFEHSILLSNDSDPNSDRLAITAFTQPTNGTVTDNGDGTFDYEPNAGFAGSDSFTYTIEDGRGGQATESVNVTVATNLAPSGTATQSSDFFGAVASRANDGNRDGNFPSGSVTATMNDSNAWWELDLGELKNIEVIELWNRSDVATDRLANLEIFVSDSPFTSQDITATRNQAGVRSFSFTGPVDRVARFNIGGTGQYVRVQLAGRNYLSLAEVTVYGSSATTPTPAPAPAPRIASVGTDALQSAEPVTRIARTVDDSENATILADVLKGSIEVDGDGVVRLI